jgi:beta-lactamase superfamily II metal-dependent hydrolase
MNILFKNVGHGDTIVLEWQCHSGVNKVGIIDCCLYEGIPQIEEYLDKNNISHIEFLALSHPHKDHYSGMVSLLTYVRKKGIIINHFIHSLFVDPIYLNWAEANEVDRKQLRELINMIIEFDNKNIIKQIQLAVLNWQMDLGNNYTIRALSPSNSELRTFADKIEYYREENRYLCSTAANYLSTIFVLSNNNTGKSILLTSDATDYSFERLFNSSQPIEEISAFQIPHHGSSKSHFKKFWDSLKIVPDKLAIVSAGFNRRYNLPDYEVIEYFDKSGCTTMSTNFVHGYKDYFEKMSLGAHEISNALDDISEQIITHYLYKPQICCSI